MRSSLPHISFARAEAARQAGQLDWILAHETQISMDRDFEIGVCELISRKDPDHLLKGSAEFLERVAALLDEQRLGR